MSRFVALILLLTTTPALAATYVAGTRTVDSAVPHRNYAEVSPGIRLANGSLAYYQTDLATKGRVLGLSLKRVWRSDMNYDGPFGQGWTCEYTQAGWKDATTGDIHWHDADGFLHTFYKGGGAWVSPPGVYVEASYDNGVRLRRADGNRLEFNVGGQITAIIDPNGNTISIAYDQSDRLETVTDDRGYDWEFVYDSNDRIIELIDHVWETATRDARSVEYDYDSNGNLIAVYMSETTRYSDANSNRVTWEYDYDSSARLTDVYAPNEVYSSGVSRKWFEWEDSTDRVVSFRDGHASGTHYLRYTQNGSGAPIVRHITPQSFRTDYELDSDGRAVKVSCYTAFWDVSHANPINHIVLTYEGAALRSSDPANFITEYEYNSGHEITSITHPEDDEEEFLYPNPQSLDSGSARTVSGSTLTIKKGTWTPNEFSGGFLRMGSGSGSYAYYEIESNTANTITVVSVDMQAQGWGTGSVFVVYSENPDPMAAGNLLEHRRISSDHQQADIVRTWTYEPCFQQVRSATCERGYTSIWEFGFDDSGDPTAVGAFNVTKMISPSVTVIEPDGSTSSTTYETEYSYNSYGQLIGVVDAEGAVEVRNYYASGDQAGFLEEKIRSYGELDITETFEYDKTGTCTGYYPPNAYAAGVDAQDFKTTWRVNELDQLWHEEGPELAGERVETYRYFDASGNEVSTWREYVTADGSAPNAPSNEHNPTTFSRSSTAMDATWVETARTFDLAGRLLTETTDTLAANPVVTVNWEREYDELGNLLTLTSPLGNVTEYEYDERYLLWRRIEAAGSSVEATYEIDYDHNGSVEVERTPLGNETIHAYDGHGRRISLTDPEGHYHDFEYDAGDNVTTESVFDVQDNLLQETTWSYDEVDRVYIKTVLAKDSSGTNIGSGEEVTRITLDGRGAATKQNTGTGRTWLFEYDDAGRLVSEEDPVGNATDWTLDLAGNVTRADFDDYNEHAITTESAAWEADYNTLGLRTKVRDRRYQGAGFDTEIEFKWDGWGRLVKVTDAAGVALEQDYDLRSRNIERREGSDIQFGQTIKSELWDDDDRLASVDTWENPSGTSVQTTAYNYDERERVTEVTHPDGSTREFEWDDDSHLDNWTDETGTRIEHTFDDNGRITARDITVSGGTTGVDNEAYEYDGAGRLVECESYKNLELLARTTWSWNTLGRADASTLAIGDGNGGSLGSWTTTSEWDVHGSLVGHGFSDSASLTIVRDGLSRISSVDDTSTTLSEFEWAGAGRCVRIELANGTETSFAYETGYSQLAEDVHHERNGETLWRIERRYDVRGLTSRERRGHQGATGRVSSFNDLRRLTKHYLGVDLAGSAIDSETVPSAFSTQHSFELDMPGNRTGSDGVTINEPNAEITADAYSVSTDGMDRYTAVGGHTRTHDSAARLTSDDHAGVEYTWDYRGRLQAINDPMAMPEPVRQLVYDAMGRRVLEDDLTEGQRNRRTVLIYSPEGKLLEEVLLDTSDEEVERVQYAWGPDGVFAEKVDEGWQYRHEDQDGSLIGITDDAGERVAEYDYLPFGAPVRLDVVFDAAPSEVSSVAKDTPAAGTTRITLSTAMTAGSLVARELTLSVPGASADRYRSGAITANSVYTIDVDDPDDLIYDAIQDLGSGFCVLGVNLATGAPTVSYDSQTDTTSLTVSGAGFSTWLRGGWLVPKVTRPAYLEIVDVDSSGDWIRVAGDATGTFESGINYRLVPPVGVTLGGFDDNPGGRTLFRGLRHDYAGRLESWPSSDALKRSGLYSDNGRILDPQTGRYLTRGDVASGSYNYQPVSGLGALRRLLETHD